MLTRFIPFEGDLGELPTDNNHLVFKWANSDCKVLFSVSRLGDAASVHFSSDKSGLRNIKKAANEFCLFVFLLFDWCTMIIAKTTLKSVGRMIKKIGFNEVARNSTVTAYAREKIWA